MMKHLRVTVDGKSYDVVVEELGQTGSAAAHAPAPAPVAAAPAAAAPAAAAPAPAPAPAAAASPAPAAGGPNDCIAPLAGILVEVSVAVGDTVQVDQPVAVLEAMKMKTQIGAHKAGRVTAVYVSAGDAVDVEQPLVSIA
jgi:glutaconyl-CoA/methylmalonyl-CoA decarboxylase subunit gamma